MTIYSACDSCLSETTNTMTYTTIKGKILDLCFPCYKAFARRAYIRMLKAMGRSS